MPGFYNDPKRSQGKKKRKPRYDGGDTQYRSGNATIDDLFAPANRAFSSARGRAADSARYQGQADAYAQQQAAGDLARQYADLQKQFKSMFDVDLPALHLLAMPNKADYTKPFDDARAQSYTTYAEAVPTLNNIYDDLQGGLKQQRAAQLAEQASARKQAGAEQSAMMQQAAALTTPTALARELGIAGPESAAGQQAAADKAFMALRGADAAQVGRQLEEADASAAAGRREDAEALRSGSLSNAKNNLDALLNQIGLGKAQAERQYAQDANETRAANNAAQQQYAQLKDQLQRNQLESMKQAEQMWADQNEKFAQAASTTGRQQWEMQLDDIQARYPRSAKAMLDIIEAAGSGPTARAKAMQLLSENASALKSGKMMDGEGNVQYGGKPVGVESVRKWLQQFYDEGEYVDPEQYARLGGDPTYLPVRMKYS
jgi:hypothetical protein